MKKIELTKEEIDVVDDVFFDFIGILTSEEVEKTACSFIEKASNFMHESNAINERGGDLIVWFWGKYLKQEGLYKCDDISKIEFSKKQKSILKAASKGNYIPGIEYEETNKLFFDIICKVCSYIAETNSYKELNESDLDYLEWFYNKYCEK